MEILRDLISALSGTPAWVPLALFPGLLIVAAVLFTVFGGRRAYVCVAAALGSACFALMCCKGTLSEAFFCLAVFAAAAALLRLLFFLPRPHRTRKEARKGREERMYERFREALSEVPDRPAPQPAKVCCFEEEPLVAAAPDASYAESLLAKLQKEKLSPTDRLEADVLARTLSALKGRPLTEEEARAFNDCLATILRLTAKYKL